MEHRDKMSQELWCRVYAAVITKWPTDFVLAKQSADRALVDFNDKYPYEGYADFGPR